MNGNIRLIVRSHLQEKSLRNYLQDKFDSTPTEEKQKFLQAVESDIEMRTDNILNAFIEDVRKDSRESRNRRKRSYLVAATSIISTIGISVSVQQNNWIITTVLGVIALAVQIYNISEEF